MFQDLSWKLGVGQGRHWLCQDFALPMSTGKVNIEMDRRKAVEICTALRFFRAIWLYFTYDNSVCNTKNFEPGVHPAPKPSFSKSEGRQVLRKALLHIYCKDKQHSLGWSWKGPIAGDKEAVGGLR